MGLQLEATGSVVFDGVGDDETEEVVGLPSVDLGDVVEGVPA